MLLSGCVGALDNVSTGSISGQLLYGNEGEEGSILSNQLIRIKGTNKVALSDLEGRFVMGNAPSGKQTLEFIRHGYKLQTYSIDVKENNSTDLGEIHVHYPSDW